MSDQQIYIAIVVDNFGRGQQLLRYAFEYPYVEYWGEPDEQDKLKKYFSEHHYSKAVPLQIEPSEVIDFLPYVSPTAKQETL